MKNSKYILAALALMVATGVFLTGCNFPPTTTPPADNNMMEGDQDTDNSMMKDNNMMEDDHDSDDSWTDEEMEMMKDDNMMEGDHDTGDAGVDEDNARINDDSTMNTGDHDIGDAGVDQDNARGRYVAYTQSDYQADLGQRPFALFFHADWCPVCQGMDKEINDNLASLPNGIKIYKVNYDKETELKKKYGINSQSLVVIINAEGKAVKTLPAPSSQQIVDALQAA